MWVLDVIGESGVMSETKCFEGVLYREGLHDREWRSE